MLVNTFYVPLMQVLIKKLVAANLRDKDKITIWKDLEPKETAHLFKKTLKTMN